MIAFRSQIARGARLTASAFANVLVAIALELRRLNRARIDSDALAIMLPREQRAAVKAALTKHHSNNPRCC